MGAFRAWKELGCVYWPIPAQTQPHTISYAGSPPILVVSTTHDPATRYPWAQAMAAQLGSAVLPTYDSDGHTAYGRGSSCPDTAVDVCLTRGTVPGPGTVCQPGSVTTTPKVKIIYCVRPDDDMIEFVFGDRDELDLDMTEAGLRRCIATFPEALTAFEAAAAAPQE
jgi:TAP-like protein